MQTECCQIQFSRETERLFYLKYIFVKCAWARKTHFCKLPIYNVRVYPDIPLLLTGEGLNILKVVFLYLPPHPLTLHLPIPHQLWTVEEFILSQTPFSCGSFPVTTSFSPCSYPMLVPRVSSCCSVKIQGLFRNVSLRHPPHSPQVRCVCLLAAAVQAIALVQITGGS